MNIELKEYIKTYPDFPAKGVSFKDISPMLADAQAFSEAIKQLEQAASKVPEFNKIVAVDARGFIFGGALANKIGKGLVMCRKAGKLPGKVSGQDYGYEYSSARIEIQKDAIMSGDKLLIIDDVLASGNTLFATYSLINKIGGSVTGILCLSELTYLNGRELLTQKIPSVPVETIIKLEK